MITEMDRIADIIEKGSKNRLTLAEFIEIQIKEFETSDEYKEMLEGERYFDTKSNIENKKRTYVDENGRQVESTLFSNSKVKYPVFVKLVNQKTGYLLNKRMTINCDNKELSKRISKFFNKRKHKQIKNTMQQSIIKGIAWWFVYVDDDQLKAKLRYANEIIPIWKDREHEELAGVIVRYFVTNYTEMKNKELIEKVEYHNLEGVRFFVRNNGKLIPDIEKIEENKEFEIDIDLEGNTLFANFKSNGKLMTWEKIPFVYFKYNSNEKSLLHYLKSLVDIVEELKSVVSDNLKDALDGINKVKGYAEDVKKFQKNLQTFKTIFLDENGDYDLVQAKIDISAFKDAIEQFTKDIYDIGCGVDTGSDKFGNQQSGVALKLLFNDLDFDCSNIVTEFQSSLEYFQFFFNAFNKLKDEKDFFEIDTEYIFNKSVIIDESAKITDIRNSEGIISRKTQLANHPLVTNVEEELKQIKNEESEQDDTDYNDLDKNKDNHSEKDDVNE